MDMMDNGVETEIMELEIPICGEEVLNEQNGSPDMNEEIEMSANTPAGDSAAGQSDSGDIHHILKNMKNKGSARKGSVTTNSRSLQQITQAELIQASKQNGNGVPVESVVSNGSSDHHNNHQNHVQLVMEPNHPLDHVEEEPTRFILINDTRNIAPFGTCLCSAKPVVSSSSELQQKDRIVYCQAIDCVDSKMIGCCNQAKLPLLFRSSKRVPYRIYCEVHLARLRRHHCCPGCGLFCTQGEFLQCFSIKKQVHLFHKSCQVVSAGMGKQHCPHCAGLSDIRSVPIQMNGPVANNTIYFLTPNPASDPQSVPKAKMTAAPVVKSATVRPATPDPADEPGVQVTIPDSQKVLSLSGLPFGPRRDMLQGLLSSIAAEKKSPLKLTPNKNFYHVARIGETDKVVSLLLQGFDPNYTFEDHENGTPLHAAAQAGHVEIVHLLKQAGADLNALNSRLNTPLMTAIESHQNEVVNYLIRAGAALDFRGEDGMTALHLASRIGNRDAVKSLIESKRMDVNLQDDGGWTALIWATEHKQSEIIELLLERKADPNIRDDEENICLHWAAFAGDSDILARFCDLCKDIDAMNGHGDTALHIAARRDHHNCVMLLTSRDADVTIVNKNKETALDCCPTDSESATILKIRLELIEAAKNRKVRSDKFLHRDISKGREKYPIAIVNRVDEEEPPTGYTYVSTCVETKPTNLDKTITSLQSCRCQDDCSGNDCMCGTISMNCWYDENRRLVDEFNFNDPPMIFECNVACECWSNCINRVVQKGIQCRLQVFRTKNKGWGVRTLLPIPKGTFVCEYVGEIISDTDADTREDDSYLFDLDHKDKETQYCVDARFYGNVARFINHGCDANLTPVKVFIDHQDLSCPRMAFFANRDIRRMEELSFDYGEKFWSIKCKSFKCDCGSLDCRFSSTTITRTLQEYWIRMQQEQQEQQRQQQPSQQTNGHVH